MSQKTCQGDGCEKPLERRNKTGYCRVCSYAHQGRIRRQAPKAPRDAFEAVGDEATLHKTLPTRPRTLEEMIAACQIDLNEWTVERWRAGQWEQGAKNADGELISQVLWTVEVRLKRNRPLIDARKELDALREAAKALGPARPAVQSSRTFSNNEHALEVNIPDLHLGKLAWEPETRGANYDLKVAATLYKQALAALIQRTSAFAFSQIILPVGNDLLHSDTKAGMTYRGTPLDSDSRFYKMFSTARELTTYAIEALRQIAPVQVVMVSGNHDTMSVWHLGDSLSTLYGNTDDVTIDNRPTLRKYVGFGKVALMFTHGDKKIDYPLLFATEQPKLFGNAKFREVRLGHLHQTRLVEKHGVRVRISPALCSADAWHSEHGYVGNVRGAEAYVWHKTSGLVAVFHYNVVE